MNEQRKMNVTVAASAVRAQLGRILASEAFVRSRRMQRFLEFIVEETLGGRADQLGEYGIGISVFDRGQDFAPAVDPIVRNDARRLRLKLLEYYRQPRPEDHVAIDIPKGGYVPVFHTLPRRCEASSAYGAPRRLAVLPFEVLSAAPESARCARALCMSLTARLSNLDGLEAIAHGYLEELPIREAAEELRLSHVIDGSVFRSHGRCCVIVNLVRIADGTQLWAREYDFEADEMPTMQSEIVRSVLREVIGRLGLVQSEALQLARAA